MNQRLVYIVAGGTGGHIYPGAAIGDCLREQLGEALDLRFIAGNRAIEARIYAGLGIDPIVLRSSQNYRRMGTPRKAATACVDFAKVLLLFLRQRPALVLAMGGAVCFPVLAACQLLRIPYCLHDGNVIPGRVVKLFAGKAKKVFLGMPGYQAVNAEVSGVPSRASQCQEPVRDVILCIGGSQGAQELNRLFLQAAAALASEQHCFVLISGPGNVPAEVPSGVEVREYEPELPQLLSRTRLAVSRAGAGALADFRAMGIPSILIPYPHAKDDHQRANARFAEELGAALVLEESALNEELLKCEIGNLIHNPDRLEEMARCAISLMPANPALAIARSLASMLSTPLDASAPVAQGGMLREP